MFKIKNIFLFILCVILIASNFAMNTYATNTTDTTDTENVTYVDINQSGQAAVNFHANIASTYSIIIPKTIILDGSSTTATGKYVVQVSGDLSGTEYITIIPDDSFELVTNGKEEITATVQQDKTTWYHRDLTDNAIGSIEANGLSSGCWVGNFMFNISNTAFDPVIPMLAEGYSWYQGETHRNKITEIDIVNAYSPLEETAEGKAITVIESWPAANDMDGDGINDDDIMCYVLNNGDDSYRLIIAGNGSGKIRLHPNSGYLFSYPIINLYDESKEKHLFSSCTTINGLSWLDTSTVYQLKSAFMGMSSLTTFDIDTFDTSNVINMNGMFYNCSNLTTLDIGNWDTSRVEKMHNMFYGCSNLTTLDIGNWDTSNVTTMVAMFSSCSNLTTLNLDNWNVGNVKNMSWMFSQCYRLTSLDVSGWNTSSVTDLSHMFYYCGNLNEIDVGNWDTSNITDMSYMFCNCDNLTTVNVSKWKTSNVTDMQSMFFKCTNLTDIDVSNFNTSKVTSMTYMFYDCNSIGVLDVSNWNTHSAVYIGAMFYNCSSVTELDVSNWDVSHVTNMGSLFGRCSKVAELDLSNWNTKNVVSMSNMFNNMSSLHKITLGKNFNFNGSGTTDTLAVLPKHSSGYWYNVETGEKYAPEDVPNGAGTYVDKKP